MLSQRTMITIIVMLILVGVTINIAAKGKLIDYAREAKEKTNIEIAKEQMLANGEITVNGKIYASLEDYLEGKEKLEEIHNWTRGTGENRDVVTCSHCNKSYIIGETMLDYHPDVVASVTTEIDNGIKNKLKITQNTDLTTEQINQIADDYETTLNADGTQTIVQETNLEWLVLGIEDQDGNGINETLLITTKTPTTNKLYLYGAAAYNNGPDIMNDVCEKLYSSSTYGKARSITIDDVNEVFGYVSTGGLYYDPDDEIYKKTEGFNTKLSSVPDWENIKNRGTYTPAKGAYEEDTAENLGEYIVDGDIYCMIDSTYIEDMLGVTKEITEREFNLIFGSCEDFENLEDFSILFAYWLASTGVCSCIDCFANFAIGFVYQGEISTAFSYSFNSINGREVGGSCNLRPVVSLTSEIPEINRLVQ